MVTASFMVIYMYQVKKHKSNQNYKTMQNTINTHVMNELEVLKSAMQFGFVKFIYKKVDGSERIAIGTRNAEYIDQVGGTPKGEDKRAKNPLLCTYFDLTKGAWRCFRTDLFVGIRYNENGTSTISKESACAQALALAVQDPSTNIEGVMKNISTLIGTEKCSRLTDYVCDNKDTFNEDACLSEVFGIGAENSAKEVRVDNSATTPTRVAENAENRLADLCHEELRLRYRLAEIEREKRTLLGM